MTRDDVLKVVVKHLVDGVEGLDADRPATGGGFRQAGPPAPSSRS